MVALCYVAQKVDDIELRDAGIPPRHDLGDQYSSGEGRLAWVGSERLGSITVAKPNEGQ